MIIFFLYDSMLEFKNKLLIGVWIDNYFNFRVIFLVAYIEFIQYLYDQVSNGNEQNYSAWIPVEHF